MAVELKKPSTFQQYKTLLRKDLEQEFRTKEMLTSMGIYALLVIIVYGAALAQTSQTTDVLQMSGGLLWALIVFTSLLGLNRSFAHEKEQGCLEGILLVPMDRSVVFLAKATSNLLFLLVLVLVLAVYRLGTPLPFRRRTRTLYLTALLSAAALVACSVLFSWFIGMSSRYSLVYGSLASLIILLVWLYFCGNILLLGAVAGRVWGQLRIPSGDD